MKRRDRLRRRIRRLEAEVLAAPDPRNLLIELFDLQRRAAPLELAALLEMPAEHRARHIRRCAHRFVSRPLAEELLQRSIQVAASDAVEAEHLARLAWEVVLCIKQADALLAGGRAALVDLQAMVQAHRGNALRLRRDFAAARRRFGRAYAFMERGSGDVEVLARLLSLHSSLLLDISQPREALVRLSAAETIYRDLEDRAQLGRTLLKCANAYRNLGEPERALEVQEEACRCLQGLPDRRLIANAVHGLAAHHCDLGRHLEAREILRQHRQAFHGLDDAVQSRLRWLQAMIHHGLGEAAWAEITYRATREGFLTRGDAYNAALVSLDLAAFYLDRGDLLRAERDALTIHPILLQHELSTEACTAFLLYMEAVRQRRLTTGLVREVRERLRGQPSPA